MWGNGLLGRGVRSPSTFLVSSVLTCLNLIYANWKFVVQDFTCAHTLPGSDSAPDINPGGKKTWIDNSEYLNKSGLTRQPHSEGWRSQRSMWVDFIQPFCCFSLQNLQWNTPLCATSRSSASDKPQCRFSRFTILLRSRCCSRSYVLMISLDKMLVWDRGCVGTFHNLQPLPFFSWLRWPF